MPRSDKPTVPLTDQQQRLVAENTGLAHAWVGRHARLCGAMHLDRDEALSAALWGLTMAARTFDPSRGFRFATYAWRAMTTRVCLDGRRARSVGDKAGVGMVPLRARLAGGEDFGPADVHADGREPDAGGPVEAAELVALVLPQLDERSRAVVWLRVVDGVGLKEVGELFGVTKERVRQIEGKALARCRELLAAADAA